MPLFTKIVYPSQLADGVVTTAKLADSAVTLAKLSGEVKALLLRS